MGTFWIPRRIILRLSKYQCACTLTFRTLAKSAKFVLVLREPVARAFSWYTHLMNHCVTHLKEFTAGHTTMPAEGRNTSNFCNEPHCRRLKCSTKAKYLKRGNEIASLATFSEFVGKNPTSLAVGHYTKWLKNWLKYFSRSQIMIINFEQLLANTPDIVHNITDFFELNLSYKASITLPHENSAKLDTVLDCASRASLQAMYAPHNQELYAYMAASFNEKPRSEPLFGNFMEKHDCE